MMEGKPENHKRALRRYHAQRRKAWVRRTLHHYFMERHALSARRVGMYSKTPKICSCFMCGNPRRYLGELTLQERRAMLDSDLLKSWTEGNPRNHEIDFRRRAEARAERLWGGQLEAEKNQSLLPSEPLSAEAFDQQS